MIVLETILVRGFVKNKTKSGGFKKNCATIYRFNFNFILIGKVMVSPLSSTNRPILQAMPNVDASELDEPLLDPIPETLFALSDSSVNAFVCQWEETANPRCGLEVGYVNDSHSTLWETREEGLELSRVLDGGTVFCLHNQGTDQSLPCRNDFYALLLAWTNFFIQYPDGVFLQYFHGDGIQVIQLALAMCKEANRIVLVGIDPSEVPNHPRGYYYECRQGIWNFRGRPGVTALNNQGATGSYPRFIDPTFTAALQFPFQKLLNKRHHGNRAVDCSAHLARILAIPTQERRPIPTSSASYSEVLQLVRSTTFASRQEDRLSSIAQKQMLETTLAILRLVDYATYFAGLGDEVVSDESSSEVSYFHPRERIVNRNYFANLLFRDGTFLESSPLQSLIQVRALPQGIYPMGIAPDGRFTEGTYLGERNASHNAEDTAYPLGQFFYANFPYERYFRGDFADEGLIPYGLPLESLPQIDCTGRFCQSLRYWHFFSGASALSGTNLSQYPGGILPNGRFPNGLYPFGYFSPEYNQTFPYRAYFRGELIAQNFQQINMTREEFITHADSVYPGWREMQPTVQSSTSILHFSPSHAETGISALLMAYWGAVGVTQVSLLLARNRIVARRCQGIALGLSSSIMYMNIVDLTANIGMAWQSGGNLPEISVRSALCLYSGISLAREAVGYAMPWVNAQAERVGQAISLVQECSEPIRRIDASFRRRIRNVRLVLNLLFAMLLGCAFLTTTQNREFSNRITRSYDNIHTWMLGAIVGILVSILLFFRMHRD